MSDEISHKEQRIRNLTKLYYSRPEIQKAIFEFSKDREIVPRYFEGFGKRPDSLQYPGDVFELVKKGATSFHCSQELWSDPLKISTNLNEKQLSGLRIGWDFLIDIDSKYLDYSKIMAEIIIKVLEFHGVKNLGLKFSGSKGFHIIIPWKAFPKEINEVKTSEMFPEWPRIITKYLIEMVREEVTEKINSLSYGNNEHNTIKKYIKREGGSMEVMKYKPSSKVEVFTKGMKSKYLKSEGSFEEIKKDESSWNKEVMPDLILVSPRHLFRAPYSLHEKTALASIVINKDEISKFEIGEADSMKIDKSKIKNFLPNAKENEASELLVQALDWNKQNKPHEKDNIQKKQDFQPIKLEKLSDDFLPPSIQKILKGIADGKKRALFVLINLFRSLGIEKEELEKRVYEWNKKNKPPLKEGYIKTQLIWSYRNKIVPPPNFDKDYYKAIGVIPNEEELRAKNPVNYVLRKSRSSNNFKK